MVPDLGQVKGMIGQLFGVLLGHDLEIQGPAGEVALFDMLVQIALVAVPVTADEFLRLGIGEVLDALLGLEMELDPEALVLRIDEAVGVAAETVHVAVRRRDAAIAHDHGDLVQGFGQQGPEVPVVRGAVHVGARVALDHMVQVGELERVTQEKGRRVVAHHVPVALVRVEFDGKAADVAFRVRCAALAGHSGETDEDFGLLADLGKERGLGILSDVMRHRERPVSTGALGVHAPLRDDLTVEMGQFFLEPDILHQHGAARTGSQGMIVIGYRRTGTGGQAVIFISHMLSPWFAHLVGAVTASPQEVS